MFPMDFIDPDNDSVIKNNNNDNSIIFAFGDCFMATSERQACQLFSKFTTTQLTNGRCNICDDCFFRNFRAFRRLLHSTAGNKDAMSQTRPLATLITFYRTRQMLQPCIDIDIHM